VTTKVFKFFFSITTLIGLFLVFLVVFLFFGPDLLLFFFTLCSFYGEKICEERN